MRCCTALLLVVALTSAGVFGAATAPSGRSHKQITAKGTAKKGASPQARPGPVDVRRRQLVEVSDVRLAGGPSPSQGRLEVLIGGAWGTVCDDTFNNDAATVVCWQLGYSEGGVMVNSSQYGPGSGPIQLDNVQCNGQETSLSQCSATTTHDCSHSEDVGVLCFGGSPAPGSQSVPVTSVRLVNGPSPREGRLEVLIGGTWGTVCDDNFDDAAAAVVCDQLGYTTGFVSNSSAYGPGSGVIHLDNVYCTGRETSLSQCSATTSHDCTHSEDVGVACLGSASAGTAAAAAPSSSSSSVPVGAIVGGVVGGLALVAIAGFVAYKVISRRRIASAKAAGTVSDFESKADVLSTGGAGHLAGASPSLPLSSGGSGGTPAATASQLDTFVVSTQTSGGGMPAAAVAAGALDTFIPADNPLSTVPTRPPNGPPASLASLLASPAPPLVGGASALPPAAAAAAYASYSTEASAAALSRDPLMSYILASKTSTSKSARLSSPGSSSLEASAHWEIAFEDIQILHPCGEGSYGRVFLGRWNETLVAVKVLLLGGSVMTPGQAQATLSLASPVLAKLESEAALMASLRHPNVVNFFGLCRDPPCIVAEYCALGSLAEVLARARAGDAAIVSALTWPMRLSMAIQAAVGMLYLHARPQPIIHRDLKSPNLLVDESWRVKVTDFNLSKILEDSSKSSSMAAMNPRWLAPELMRGQRANKASDVYAFGVVMWELLTWELPWSAANPWQLVTHVTGGGRLDIPPRHQLPGADTAAFAALDGYVALLQRCWAQAPADRPGFEAIIPQLRELFGLAAGTPLTASG